MSLTQGGLPEVAHRLDALQGSIDALAMAMPCAHFSEFHDGRIASIDDRLLAWLGRERLDVVGRRQIHEFLSPSSRGAWARRGWSIARRRSGASLDVEWQALPERSCESSVQYLPPAASPASGIGRRALVFNAEWTRLRRAIAHGATLGEAGLQGHFLLDADGCLRALDSAFTQLTGHEVADAAGRGLDAKGLGLLAEGSCWDSLLDEAQRQGSAWGELRLRHRDGHVFEAAVSLMVWRPQGREGPWTAGRVVALGPSGVPTRLQFGALDVDVLTGLPNRRGLRDRLQIALSEARHDSRPAALMLLDLDNFKQLNDTQGHDAGDALLVMVAQRLQQVLRSHDTVARLGGDEFALLVTDLAEDRSAALVAAQRISNKVLESLAEPFDLSATRHCTSASLGIAVMSGVESTASVLQQADLAMYAAKRAGRGQVCHFESSMLQAVTAEATLGQDLAQALRLCQLHLNFQPKVDGTGTVLGAEVLLRWRHPTRGLVSPAEFMPLAERHGAILAIGPWVMDQACQQLKRWAEQPRTQGLHLAVNVSARQFSQPNFVQQVVETLRVHGVNPRWLRLELTESMVHDVEDTRQKMSDLCAAGVSFSMDDFGTGYSSLSSLTRLPLAELKIDRSFVAHMAERASDAVVVQTIVSMAHSLGLAVVAEGVETAAQRDALRAVGCAAFQGYWFGRPMDIEAFEAWLQDRPVAAPAAA